MINYCQEEFWWLEHTRVTFAKYLRVRECSPAMVKSLFGGDFKLKLNDLILLSLNIASNMNWIVNHSAY
jgi:hypothetical protein